MVARGGWARIRHGPPPASRAVRSLQPAHAEMAFWYAVALATAGKIEAARPLFAQAFAADPRWRELVRRLPDVNQLPKDPQLLDAVLSIR
jgi:hypothetical protein